MKDIHQMLVPARPMELNLNTQFISKVTYFRIVSYAEVSEQYYLNYLLCKVNLDLAPPPHQPSVVEDHEGDFHPRCSPDGRDKTLHVSIKPSF